MEEEVESLQVEIEELEQDVRDTLFCLRNV